MRAGLIIAAAAPLLWLALLPCGTRALAQQPPPASRAVPKLKVGVIVSLYTATEPSWLGRPYGFKHADAAKDFDDPSVELYAIVDPDTQGDEQVLEALKTYFPAGRQDRLIDGSDAKALAQLHAIVALRAWNMHDAVLAAIDEAVKSGVGLVNAAAMGTVTPGFTSPLVSELAATTNARYAYNSRPQPVEILEKDFLPAELLPKPADGAPGGDGAEAAVDAELKVKPNGAMGALKVGATPILKLKDRTGVGLDPNAVAGDVEFYPLVVADHGKGRIIVCNMHDPPDWLKQAADGKFYLRCVESLVEAKE
jgi:hypothetical protein